MATWIKVLGRIVKINESTFTKKEIQFMLGNDFEIIKLMSDDLLFVRKDYAETIGYNGLASILSGKEIYGDALILTVEEYDECDT